MRIDSGLHAHAGSLEGYPYLDEWVDQARFCEQAGFGAMWGAEHHFFWDGWSTPTPTNPLMVGGYLAAHTERIRLAQCGMAINDWHPIRLAEDAAMLDHMSGGRMEFGFMRGLNNRVNGNFNVDGDRRDVPKANALMWEGYDILRKAWSGKPFTHEGQFYRFPVKGWKEQGKLPSELDPNYYAEDGELIALSVQPTPLQKPHPPMWLMADSAGSHVEAAQRGVNVLSWGRSPRAAKESWDAYRAALVPDAGVSGGGNLALMRFVYVAPTMEEAHRDGRPAVNDLFGAMGSRTNPSWGRKGMLASDEEMTPDQLNCDWFDYLRGIDWAIVGTPEYVTETLMRLESEIGLQHLVMYWSVAALEPTQLRRSQELFAENVMPHFSRVKALAG